MKKKTVGIDLGSNNSVAAMLNEADQVEVIANERGEELTPSVAKFDPESVTVGKPALNSAVAEPDRVVQEVKRHMGEEWEYESPEGETYTPEEISSFYLDKLKNAIELRIDEEVKKAVVSHPAEFGSYEREATKTAAEIAGFEDVTLITEPEAAAFSELKYGTELKGRIMVVDIGGTTSDVSILELTDRDITTKTTEGDLDLAGTNLTNRLIEEMENDIGEVEKPDLKQEWFKRTEEAKIDLSDQKQVSFSVPTPDGLKSFQFTRKEVEGKFQPFVDDMTDLCETALSNINKDWKELNQLLLVGGTARLPLLKKTLKEKSGMEPLISPQPEKAIAIGASIQSASMEGINILSDSGESILPPSHDSVLSKPIGVKAIDAKSGEEVNEIILEKDTPLPANNTEIFTTERDRQSNVRITLLEGRSRKPKNCTLLGEEDGHILEGIDPKPAGVPKIELTLEIDEEGLLTGEAVDRDSGHPLKFRQEIPELLSDQEKEESKERLKNKTNTN